MKKILSVVCVALALSTAACSSKSASGDDYSSVFTAALSACRDYVKDGIAPAQNPKLIAYAKTLTPTDKKRLVGEVGYNLANTFLCK